MNPWIIRGGTAAVIAAGAAALIAAGSPDVTRPRLEASLTRTFTNLYVQQSQILGSPVTAESVGAGSTCHRTAAKQDVGAGPDWVCQVTWTGTTGAPQSGKFELAAKASYCYVGSGPSKTIGPVTILDTSGREVPNPLFEFDACYDPAS